MHYLGIEIGGTKIQIGLGPDDGRLRSLWRDTVDVAAGPDGIRRQIASAVPELLASAGIPREQLRGVGIGFGGPVDDATRTVIKSHQITGWDNFPLADWVADLVGAPAAMGNDADVAGLAEALHGAGKGLSPIFYITIGSGIGGGLVVDGEIYRGVGRGAAEIGHLRIAHERAMPILEEVASGWGIEDHYRRRTRRRASSKVQQIASMALAGDQQATTVISSAREALATAMCHVIALLCPRRFVIGGGVSLLGEELLFEPLRQRVNEIVFKPFAGLTDIVPASLGEEVVVHGAIALARKKLG